MRTVLPGHVGRLETLPSAPVRRFLARYARTLAVLLVSMAVLFLGWSSVSATEWVSSHPWWSAMAATTGWGLAVATWLRRQGWRRSTVHTVTWAAPAALLLPLVWIGWVLPGELVLWGPSTSLIAVATALAADPMGVHDPRRSERARSRSGHTPREYGPTTGVSSTPTFRPRRPDELCTAGCSPAGDGTPS
jgi:hypothetical protein